jgi:hypothetical protein
MALWAASLSLVPAASALRVVVISTAWRNITSSFSAINIYSPSTNTQTAISIQFVYNLKIMNSKVPVPFAEPPWLCGLPSAYYTDSHRRWQKACREFMDKNLISNAMEWDQEELVPENVFNMFAQHNMLIPSLPAPLPTVWLKKLGIHELAGGVKVEDFDYIHMMIYTDEVNGPSAYVVYY